MKMKLSIHALLFLLLSGGTAAKGQQTCEVTYDCQMPILFGVPVEGETSCARDGTAGSALLRFTQGRKDLVIDLNLMTNKLNDTLVLHSTSEETMFFDKNEETTLWITQTASDGDRTWFELVARTNQNLSFISILCP